MKAATRATPGSNGPPPSSRIVGLDALRAILLSYGILVHTANLKIEPIFFFIEESSGLFRMDAFFFLSGLLTALTIGRLPPGQWLRGRARALGVPLLFGLLLLNPLFFFVQYVAPKTAFMIGFVERNHFDWHLHLWFLFSLIFFTIVAFAIRVWRANRGVDGLPERMNLIPPTPRRSVKVMLLVLAFPFAHFCVTFVMSRLLYAAPGLGAVSFIIQATVTALPFYLLGYLMPGHAGLRTPFSSSIYWLVGLLSIPLLAERMGFIHLAGWERAVAAGVGHPAFALAFILIVTPWFVRLEKIPRIFRMLSESSYAMYIVHLLLVSIFLYTFAWAGFGIYLTAILTAGLTFGAALALHFGLVRQHAWLRFLVNGRDFSSGRPPS